jgi:hypothetical protein
MHFDYSNTEIVGASLTRSMDALVCVVQYNVYVENVYQPDPPFE